ncbi:MAG: IS30 family transposase [Dechloromonas sp.]|uniref:IS30 family transposase n=1 Tax=Candidatus Dechloromonas phosphorivorans TaxID=2899244 RepID=A0A9D7QLC9_9RHOO|nr:IS30 family transposase [Candidatus Dechloromonas phosphorivorans]
MGTNYKHLSCEERTMIQLSLEQGCTLRAIARSVQRAPSSISRELNRNGWSNPAMAPKRRGRPRVAGGYRAPQAQHRADVLTSTPRCPSRLAFDGPLWGHVERLLREHHSPEQITGILQRMHPDQPTLQASHETIYTALYAMPRGALRSELIACLRQARKSRRPRARGEDRRGTIPDMVSIHQRPPEIDERIIPGHWEGDLIKGARNASSIGTLVERTTLFVTLVKMEDATADTAATAFGTVLNRIDAQKRLSLTYDQGREMTQHARLTETTGVAVYFADPHSPWQRGINENTNGLLRQYFPKGSDLSGFSQAELDAVAWQLNTRPRKSLNFRCPIEMFMPESFDFFEHHHLLVALGT